MRDHLLENGAVVGEVLFDLGTAQAMAAGTLVIDMASIRPSEARDHAARLERGWRIWMRPSPAAPWVQNKARWPSWPAAACRTTSARCRCLPPWAATHVGPHGAGQLAKLANQMIVGITIGAVAEALLFAAKGGADMAKVREAIPAALPTAASCNCTASAWWSATLPRTGA
jgi:2-hydroxy-3-oxopropionate reductase